MFTNNFIKSMYTKIFGLSLLTGIDASGASESITVNNTQNWSNFNQDTSSNINNDILSKVSQSSYNRFMVKVGSGTTPPTVEDINLENIIPSSILKLEACAIDTDLLSSELKLKVEYAVSNLTENDVTINEIGIFSHLNNTSSTNYVLCLMWRDVLNKPITIKANKIRRITVILDFNKLNG